MSWLETHTHARWEIDSPETLLMAALLHDASEAYLVDIPAPLKRLPFMEGYRALERRVQRAILGNFLHPHDVERYIDHPAIAHADLAVLHREKISVVQSVLEWGELPDPAPQTMWTEPEPLDMNFVERMFRMHLDGVANEARARK